MADERPILRHRAEHDAAQARMGVDDPVGTDRQGEVDLARPRSQHEQVAGNGGAFDGKEPHTFGDVSDDGIGRAQATASQAVVVRHARGLAISQRDHAEAVQPDTRIAPVQPERHADKVKCRCRDVFSGHEAGAG